MSKIICVPSSKDNLIELLKMEIDGVLISIHDFSVNNSYSVSLNELENLILKIKENHKEVFISLNKLMHNKDIDGLAKTLNKLNTLNIDGVLFYDLAVLEIAKEINFTKNLGIFQNHSNNSIYSNNFYHSLGIDYSLISNELTLEEVFEINKNTDMKLILPVYGHIPMCYSKRKLITSYFDYINKNKKDNSYFIKDNDNYHIVKEEESGTSIYNSNIIDLDYEFSLIIKNNIDYVILYSEFISDLEYISIVNKYINIRKNKNVDKNNLYKGFAYTKTISKVGNSNE